MITIMDLKFQTRFKVGLIHEKMANNLHSAEWMNKTSSGFTSGFKSKAVLELQTAKQAATPLAAGQDIALKFTLQAFSRSEELQPSPVGGQLSTSLKQNRFNPRQDRLEDLIRAAALVGQASHLVVQGFQLVGHDAAGDGQAF